MRRFTFWAIALAVLVIIVFNVQGWMSFSRTSRVFEAELGERLQAIAVTLSASLGSTPADSLAARAGLLRTVMHENGLFNLVVVDDRLEYIVNVRDAESVGRDGAELGLDVAEVLAAFAGAPTQSELYRQGGVYLKSAYAPVYGIAGIPAAVLGVEADAGFYSVLGEFRNSLLLVNILSLAAIAIIIIVSVSLARHALRVEQAASRANTLALMGQMSAAVAHEIKNPLGIIRASAERLKKKYGGTDDPTFDYIQEEVDRLSRVVSNYLGLGKHKPAEVEQLDLGAVIKGVVGDLDHQARKAGVEVTLAVPDLPPLIGNRNELRQMLLNIILNAIQAQPEGGKVELTAAAVTQRDKELVRLSVRDHGPGFPTEAKARAFEPFFTTREKGSGLGLFVVRRIAEAHRGRVRIQDAEGIGTVVEVELPS